MPGFAATATRKKRKTKWSSSLKIDQPEWGVGIYLDEKFRKMNTLRS
jgi:hypothetical protein